ncbi:sugar transferase domain protein [Bordetella holmesii CDC-H635-BH]|nr:sugar transferase domain protein [Bordetella holmesii CDC-H635-BH]
MQKDNATRGFGCGQMHIGSTRLQLDVWYVDHHNWRLDLLILWRTIWVVLGGVGIGSPGQATGEEFRGQQETGESS